MDKTVWYLGFKVTLESATVRRLDGAAVLDIPVRLENQRRINAETRDVISSTSIIVTSNGRATVLSGESNLPLVPGRATGKGTMRFGVRDDFSLSDAVVTLGSPDKNQATVPLGQSGNLVTLEPVPVNLEGGSISASAGNLSVGVDGGEVRSDGLDTDEVPKGHRALLLHLTTVSTPVPYGYAFGPANLLVRLPDGTSVGSETVSTIEVAYPDKPLVDIDAWFLIDDPPVGTYQLIVNEYLKGATGSVEFSVG